MEVWKEESEGTMEGMGEREREEERGRKERGRGRERQCVYGSLVVDVL